jgi:acetyl-CoA acetyltransferase
MPKEVFIVAAKRTAFGTFGGKLKEFTANELGGFAAQAAMKQLPQGTPISSVIFGNVAQTSNVGIIQYHICFILLIGCSLSGTPCWTSLPIAHSNASADH